VLVGMGGYIAAPAATAAAIWRIPIVLHDSNSVLGRVNRILAPKAAVIASGLPLVNFPEGVDPAKIAEVGTPVRLSIPRGDREEAARETYLRTDAFTLFIYGGSLGAVGLNDLMAETVGHICAQWPEDAPPFQVIWEAGPDNLTQVRNALEDKHLKGQFWIAPSIERMDHAYALADLVIGRAGGSFLAELLLCGLPSILFPLPTAADQHQHHNAAVLKRRRAAIVREQDETDPRQLADEILTLVREPQRLAALAEVAEDLACPSAARDLARLVVETATGESAV